MAFLWANANIDYRRTTFHADKPRPNASSGLKTHAEDLMVLQHLKSRTSNRSARAVFVAGVLFASTTILLGIILTEFLGALDLPSFAIALSYAILSIAVIALCLVYTLLMEPKRCPNQDEQEVASHLRDLQLQISSLEEKTLGGAHVLSERMLQIRQAIDDLRAPKP